MGRCMAALLKLGYVLDNFILINADAFHLALIPCLQSIWFKLLRLFCSTKPALSNKVLAPVSTGASKLPLCLQEPLKLLIAVCANGPYTLDEVFGKSCTNWSRLGGVCTDSVWMRQKMRERRKIGSYPYYSLYDYGVTLHEHCHGSAQRIISVCVHSLQYSG